MIIISNLLDKYFQLRLSGKAYRIEAYKKAFDKKLRKSKYGFILLRNLNLLLNSNPVLHNELTEIIGKNNYQKHFWESDFGFFWYQGNINAKNYYFKYAINEIIKESYFSVLDVGCGWGEFSDKVSKLNGVKLSTGIDISEKIIEEAKNKHKSSAAQYFHRNVLDENNKYDFITLFGSTDYIHPSSLVQILEKVLTISTKRIVIVNSLRHIPFNDAIELEDSKEIRRYDIGYVHPLNNCLKKLKAKYSFSYKIEKAGIDSMLVDIIKL